MDEEVKCPYCNSKDLSKLPDNTALPGYFSYKCQMCGRTFSKENKKEEKEI